ncbi:MAG TPA: SDR family oxidoreductase [Solirubrobacteraceae bacterium]|jgi:3-oxoacyl-[acyl-carrier protein] reductase/(S)-1-phenylethanol dehydrogenase|nr:SDR family oxidoreductase [Solirubrobacteraceae bacterium]
MRVALVTGGARGIGRACAARLAQDGYRVLIADRAGAAEAAADIDGAQGLTVDLADPFQTQQMAASVLAEPGRCDVLVNNAAHLGRHPFEELDLDIWRQFHAVNVEAPFLLCLALVPAMALRGGGRVVNIVSNTVWAPPAAGLCAYVTTKGALLGFTRALAVEFGGRGVTVNAVAPGLTPTPGSRADMPTEQFDAVREQQAIDRPLMPEDVAAAVSYLASDDAAAVTGQALRVDGGLVTL